MLVRHWVPIIVLALAWPLVQCARIERQAPVEDSCGFHVHPTSGERISWKNKVPIAVHIDRSVPDEFVPAVQAALEAWNQAAGRTLFQPAVRSSVRASTREADGMNSIVWWTQEPWFGPREEQARTTAFVSSGRIYEFDIYINARSPLNPQGFELHSSDLPSGLEQLDPISLLVHELGHGLGQTHTEEAARNSVMVHRLAYSSFDGSFKTRREPSPSDVRNVRCEYR